MIPVGNCCGASDSSVDELAIVMIVLSAARVASASLDGVAVSDPLDEIVEMVGNKVPLVGKGKELVKAIVDRSRSL